MQPEPFLSLCTMTVWTSVFPSLWGCLGGPWYESAVEHLESKRATSFDVTLFVWNGTRLVDVCVDLIVTHIRAGVVIDNNHVVSAVLVYYAYACFCYGSAIHLYSMSSAFAPFCHGCITVHAVCGVL